MRKILVANRGEIAVRIIRACRDMDLAAVAVYSECDRAARHVRMADEAVAIGGNAPSDSYLRIERLVDAARRTGADAVHPGYGFLAENAEFAEACRSAGLTFIGPGPDAIRRMGSKTAARQAAVDAGVPVVPGSAGALGPDVPESALAAAAAPIGYPLMVKAVAGGGGKGMRVAENERALPGAVRAARSEAGSAFGDASIYFERRLTQPRHVEVQVLADHHGAVLPFVERECSIQRRHQKLVEETPSPVVSPDLRARMTAAAAAAAAGVGYTNAGTIEFLLDADGRFYFLEMNTRLQVEHPITEAVTGVDLVEWQIRIARGERLALNADDVVRPRGHAIECRIYAENPDNGFLPSPGRIDGLRAPEGPGIRNDTGVDAGGVVPPYYDPLISKLVAWGTDRDQAAARMGRALAEYDVLGIRTTVPFFRWLLRQPAFAGARFHTSWLDELLHERRGAPFSQPDASVEEVAAIAAALLTVHEREHGRADVAGPAEGIGVRGPAAGDEGWKRRGRTEGLRG